MKNILMFIGGLTIGAGVSWMYHKNKYEKMVQEEVESLREHAKEKEGSSIDLNQFEEQEAKKVELQETEEEIEEQQEQARNIINYNKYSTPEPTETVAEKYKKPFVVTPEDFASVVGFDTDSFYFFADDVIANGSRERIDDVEELFGLSIDEIKDQFGVYEEDCVYIRNMRMKCDYEILKDEEYFE
jgi:AraC-like DNA-binding protein